MKKSDEHKVDLPGFVSYKDDDFGGWKWTWDWKLDGNTCKSKISNLQAHCPLCDTPMFHNNGDTAFECPRCDFHTGYMSKHKKRRDVEAIIIDNVNRLNKS